VISVPGLAVGDDVLDTWYNGVAGAVAEVQDLLPTTGRAAVTPQAANWENYSGGFTQAQVNCFGPLVVMTGLIRVKAGATAQTPGSTYVVATVPVGYRPRDVGAANPLGGRILTACQSSVGSPARIDITVTGDVIWYSNIGNLTMAAGQWIALNAWWTRY